MDSVIEAVKNFRPKLLHKVLVLFFLPLLLALLFFLQLYQLVSRAEAMAALERRQSEIVEHINTITLLFANAGGSMASYSITGGSGYLQSAKEYAQQFRQEMDTLQKLTPMDQQGRAKFGEFRQVAEAEFAQLSALGPPEAGLSYDQAMLNLKGLRSMIKQARVKTKIIMRVCDEEKAELAKIREREAVSRTEVKQQIMYGIIGTFVYAACAMIFFLRDITGRLKLLVENARLLPADRPLAGRVGGSDELAYLDRVLHESFAQLRRAAEHREQVMEMVAHDLRSPLMSSQISLEILASERAAPPPVQKHILGVKHNVALVVGLVNDLLTIDKLEAGKLELAPENFVVGKVAADAMETVAGLAGRKEITVLNQCSGDYSGQQPAFMAYADKARVLQVLINYLSNAIKFSPKQSTIIVKDQIDRRAAHMLRLSVTDQGPGIEARERKRLFERFYQAESGEKKKGFGLGLAICKLIIESHGGEVGVESEPGKGSTFWFTIPLADTASVEEGI